MAQQQYNGQKKDMPFERLFKIENIIFASPPERTQKILQSISKIDPTYKDYIIKILIFMTKTRRLKYNIIADYFNALGLILPEQCDPDFKLFWEKYTAANGQPLDFCDDIFPMNTPGFAIVHDNVAILQAIVENSNKEELVNTPVQFMDQKLSLLNLAAHCGAINCFNYLLQYTTQLTEDVLDGAVAGGDQEIIKKILSLRSDFNLKNHLRTAIKYHHNTICGMIYKQSPDEFLKVDMQFCVVNMNRTMYNIIIKEMMKKEILNSPDANMQPPLVVASRLGEIDIVEYLLECNANIDATDSIGETALLTAATFGHSHIVCFLVTKGANIEATDKYHWTPLMAACANGHEECVKVLINNGANMLAKDILGKSCYDRATANVQSLLNFDGRGQFYM
ncbi:hypothetical protein TVAG_363900 [Trichomonas vaginalis G3]|uniref:DUF3447 domain-containing protein n=1 Tax=Trichomonas vaginalis (strain ATCC PRA-98 / G3) TaxID=412133 RepID=A2EDV9_TRIV3|nr:EP4 subtype prostaglandin E2 receptor binding [Trichomonas vaginalis G3]EAY09175.1 hypothetical protein TVAG_363900 [Trichomonas vaginalis G3]KAI5487037.1 EP4 subtype prostaglandin E2 receptor binding [Trichomonas vaginalis G3]|eukprot:XP_001321398.1 hypothetical protein [Trichomonas vaginalis G3]